MLYRKKSPIYLYEAVGIQPALFLYGRWHGSTVNSPFVWPDALEQVFVLSLWDCKPALQLQIEFRLLQDIAKSGAELHKACLLFLIHCC